jgi:hypothetical protein
MSICGSSGDGYVVKCARLLEKSTEQCHHIKLWVGIAHRGDVKLLPVPQPPLRARTDVRTNQSAQRATQLRIVLARVYAVARQNQLTINVP